MNCPECSASMSVLRTEDTGPVIFRRRECRECGHRITTEESIAKQPIEPTATYSGQTEFSIGLLLHSLGVSSENGLRRVVAQLKMLENEPASTTTQQESYP